jgi:hypothetical protein
MPNFRIFACFYTGKTPAGFSNTAGFPQTKTRWCPPTGGPDGVLNRELKQAGVSNTAGFPQSPKTRWCPPAG